MNTIGSDSNDQDLQNLKNTQLYEGTYENATTSLIMETRDSSHDLKEHSKLCLSTKKLDLLQILPPELALQCLLESLPSHGYLYPSAVFELVSVSKRWQAFIISSQAFWREIYLMSELDDFSAIVSTFAHLSGTSSLDIIVWGEMPPDLPVICSILLPCKDRIHRLIFRPLSQSMDSWPGRMSTAVQLIGSLGHLPNLREVDFGGGFQWSDSQIKALLLPPTTYITNILLPFSSMEDMDQIELQRITKMRTSSQLDNLVPWLESLQNLTELDVSDDSDSEVPPLKTPVLERAPSHLKSIFYRKPYCVNLGRLLRLASSQLTQLDLEIPLSKVEELVKNLESMRSLNVLCLTVTDWSANAPLISAVCNTTISTLHTLEITSTDYVGEAAKYNTQPVVWLLETFKTLYPAVKRVILMGDDALLYLVDQYIRSLRSIERIQVLSSSVPPGRIFLPSLQRLHCVSELLAYFDVPNLLSLFVAGIGPTSQLNHPQLSNLRKLAMRIDGPDELDLNIDGTQYPNLCELKLTMNSAKQRWELSSFPQLSSITIIEHHPFSTHGTRLCLSLIYNPEIYPSLRHLRLSAFVEWDILFLMLQRRNCDARGVSKISSLDRRGVPPTFQPLLSALLEGASVDVLGNEELSMEATREAICDATM